MVEAASAKIALEVLPPLVGNNPLFVVAALTLALAHVSVLSGQSYEDVVELFQLHYKATSVADLAQDAKEAGITLVPVPGPKGEPS